MKTVTAKVQNANAPGLKMAARSSEFGCDTPQKSQRMAPDHTVAEQFLQERFAFRIAEMETNKSLTIDLVVKELENWSGLQIAARLGPLAVSPSLRIGRT